MCLSFIRIISVFFFFFKQKTAYGMLISDWSSTCALPICLVVLRPPQFADQQLVDLAPVHVDDFETPALVDEALALLRQVLQDRQRVTSGGRTEERRVGKVCVSLC